MCYTETAVTMSLSVPPVEARSAWPKKAPPKLQLSKDSSSSATDSPIALSLYSLTPHSFVPTLGSRVAAGGIGSARDIGSVRSIPNGHMQICSPSTRKKSCATAFKACKEISRGLSATVTAPARQKRRAVLIGINYSGTPGAQRLDGSNEKLRAVYALLTELLGFEREEIWVLADRPRPVTGALNSYTSTRANMLNAMRWLLEDTCKGDELFFWFGGIGCQTARETRISSPLDSEVHSCILPSDYPLSDPITDDELHRTMVRPLLKGATLTCVFDCRFSARILKLPHAQIVARGKRGFFKITEQLPCARPEDTSVRGAVVNSVLRFSGLKKGDQEKRKARADYCSKVADSYSSYGAVICISTGIQPELEARSVSYGSKNGTITSAFIASTTRLLAEYRRPSYRQMLCAMSSWITVNKGLGLLKLSSTHSVSPDSHVSLLRDVSFTHSPVSAGERSPAR